MLELARRRRLTFPVQSRFRRRFGCCHRFNFGDLTEEDANLRPYLDGAALREVCDYIYENTCVNVVVKSPISTRWRVMLVLWTNYDMEEKRRLSQAVGSKWEKVRDFMDEAMNECSSPGSDRSEPLWWWSMHNDLVSSSSASLVVIYTNSCSSRRISSLSHPVSAHCTYVEFSDVFVLCHFFLSACTHAVPL